MREPAALVFAVCHEIGNLLAASRLHAHRIGSDRDLRELGRVADTLGQLAARAGSLAAQVRPLLSPPTEERFVVAASDVLDALARGIDESCDARVRIDHASARGLPDVVADPEPLHEVLLTAVYQALDESRPDGLVRVSAGASPHQVAFRVTGGTLAGVDDTGALRGRVLVQRVAEAIFEPRSGRVRADAEASCFEVGLPIAGA